MAKSTRDLGRYLRQRGALADPAGPVKVGGEIGVAEAEPGDCPETLQGVHGAEGVSAEAPPRGRVDGTGKGVGDRVEVWADVQSVQLGVVTGVDDADDLGRIDHRLADRRAFCAAPTPPQRTAITNRLGGGT